MNDVQFIALLRAKQQQLQQLFQRKLPVMVGAMAKHHFQENFRLGGFVNNGLQKWVPARRTLQGGAGASDNYSTLLSGRNHLFSSIGYKPGSGSVTIGTSVLYAGIHNFGGATHPTVTAKMRGFAWAMYYKNGGGVKGQEPPQAAQRWKALALTRKQKLNIKIPKRQFIGDSRELTAAIGTKIQTEIASVLSS